MELQQVKDLIRLLEESRLHKLVFKKGDFEVQLEKEAEPKPVLQSRTIHPETTAESAFQSEIPLKGERGGAHRVDAPGNYVTSPMVGTFYATPAPDQPPFVKVGDTVHADTIVCIIEAMKVMNEVKAGVSGTVQEIIADNAQPVEFGARLLRIT